MMPQMPWQLGLNLLPDTEDLGQIVTPEVQEFIEEAEAWFTSLLGRAPGGHEHRVMLLALRLAHEAGHAQTSREARQVVWAGLLHDIGKSALDQKILEKPGVLNVQEMLIIQQHPAIGYRLACSAPQVDAEILGGIMHHHERWDGEGYPMGLMGESIPLLARVLKVVDVYDALVSDRPYRPAWSIEEAADYLRQHAGTAFETRLIQVFVERVLSGPPQTPYGPA